MRTKWFLIVLAASSLVPAAVTPAGAGGSTKQTFAARNVYLAADEWIAIALHPNEAPIEVDSSQRDLEVCPASFDGQRPEDGNGSSWPSFTEFDECIALDSDGHATLPSTVVNTFHLAFLVRGIDGIPVDIKRLTVNHEPEDPYFVVFPPAIEPGGRSSTFTVTPDARETVYASARSIDYASIRGVRLEITQRGERVPVEGGDPVSQSGAGYGPVTLGRRVVLRVANHTEELQLVTLSVDWS